MRNFLPDSASGCPIAAKSKDKYVSNATSGITYAAKYGQPGYDNTKFGNTSGSLNSSGGSSDLKDKDGHPMDTSEAMGDEKVRIIQVVCSLGSRIRPCYWSLQENSDKRNASSNVNATKLNNYYESLRTNVMSILGHVRMPNEPVGSGVGHSSSAAAMGLAAAGTSSCLPDNISQENFDSYLSKLQTICTDSMHDDSAVSGSGHIGGGVGGSSGGNSSKPVMYDSVKSALQNFNALSTRI